VTEFLNNLNSPSLITLLIAMLPIAELRGAIPIAILKYHLPVWKSVLIAMIGNLLPVIPLLIFLEKMLDVFSKWRPTKKLVAKLIERTKSRSKVIEQYKIMGLAIFVGIPLPITGAWTGSLASVILGMKFFHALIGIIIGVCIAAVIVTTLTLLGKLGGILAGCGLIGFLIFTFLQRIKHAK